MISTAEAEIGSPNYIVGFTVRKFVGFVIFFGACLAAFYTISPMVSLNPGNTNQYFPSIQFSFQGLFFIFESTALIGAFVCAILSIVTGIATFTRGNFAFFDDHVIWTRGRSVTRLNYSELEDAYFGYIGSQTSAASSPYGAGPSGNRYYYSRVVSFYVGKKRFTFGVRKQPGLTQFLEERIPRENIDVDDS